LHASEYVTGETGVSQTLGRLSQRVKNATIRAVGLVKHSTQWSHLAA